jgi:aminoglycoside phosphotransferase (APT) family kinase protein
MERVPGVITGREFPPELTFGPAGTRALALRFIDLLVELHQVDPAKAGLADLGRGPGYVRRQVGGWSARYRRAHTDNVPAFEGVMAWLDSRQPARDAATCVIHNDFKFDNIVFGPTSAAAASAAATSAAATTGDVSAASATVTGAPAPARVDVVGVLDWEMATLGDPLMDLSGVVAYWVQADDDDIRQLTRQQPTNAPGMPTRDEVVDHYCARTGLSARNWAFYEVFGLFRLAVIIQQIYYRFHHGQTTNPIFSEFWRLVGFLETVASERIARSGL